MNNDTIFIFIIVIFALSAALLTWFAIDLGTGTMAKYRATFTERAKFQAQEFFLCLYYLRMEFTQEITDYGPGNGRIDKPYRVCNSLLQTFDYIGYNQF